MTVHVYTSESSRNANSSTLEPNWLQHDHPAVSTTSITQQYSAATFVSLKVYSYMERFGILAYFLTYLVTYIRYCVH